MRLSSRIWLAVSLLLFAGAAYFWYRGDLEADARRARAQQDKVTAAATAQSKTSLQTNTNVTTPSAQTNAAAPTAHQYRLSNTTRTLGQLTRDNHAVLLRNALIDTARPANLSIPDDLKADKEPGSYVVQARKPLDAAFYNLLKQAGAGFVSYIPNNAALVTASDAVANELSGNPMIQSVLPYEPYYKLDSSLLEKVMENKEIDTNGMVGVTAFPDGRAALLKRIEDMGLTVLGEQKTPFGTEVFVKTSDVVKLAQAAEVQEIETVRHRALLNDLSRVALGVSTDTLVTSNYLNLTGSNIIVAINDTGVDASHPDLEGRVFTLANAESWVLQDSGSGYGAGHGTHVAATIAGDGTESDTVTNASGSSVPGIKGQFRGMAPSAKLFIQPVSLLSGALVSDSYLQEMASKTNALICNNSWGYESVIDYNMSSASYDAATRDAQTEVSGSQPLLFVFAAGNSGDGMDDGTGGVQDTIVSPANAKNVITVGALESERQITDKVGIDGETNAFWQEMTDSSSEVASYSSRGNTGVGIEGDYGRFKPDVVAPGTFIVSARSTNYVDPVASAESYYYSYTAQEVKAHSTNLFVVSVPDGGVSMSVSITANSYSPVPFPTNMIVTADDAYPPTTERGQDSFTVGAGDWYIGVSNVNNQLINYDLTAVVLVTNSTGDEYEVLSNMNARLGPYYRYESGTSMAAAEVSGVLALMQERLAQIGVTNPSPALMKALLINGARASTDYYDFQVARSDANFEGWGEARIANSIPSNVTSTNTGSMRFFDQSPTRALTTGETHEYKLHLSATNNSLRVTLVWTDPPGNPAASIKLVNDLDLIVSNTVTHEVAVGNDFQLQSTYTESTTNQVDSDVVNNVENVYLSAEYGSLAGDYVIMVKGNRINVNAVTAHTNGIAQDYALVISSGARSTSTALTVDDYTVTTNSLPWVLGVTNGVPLLYQHVGANSPLIGTTNGTDIQWRFFIFTNTVKPTNTPYVALATFMPPNLSSPRNTDADIDLYVSTDPDLTNLDSTVLANCDKSLNRGGTEVITYSNSTPGTVYYCGVKAEDQKSAEFGFLALASATPFSQVDENGNIVANALPMPTALLDSTLTKSQKVPVFAFALDSTSAGSVIRRVVVQEQINHPVLGDLYGVLNRGSGGSSSTVINNHSDHGTNLVTFDDFGEEKDAIHTDGPGSLTQYVGKSVNSGAWVFWLTDNAAVHTGTLEAFNVLVSPRPAQNNDYYITLRGYGSYYDYVDVPTDATNLSISVTYSKGTGPVDISINATNYPPPSDHETNGIAPPGGSLSFGTDDVPPLAGGRWYYKIYNESASSVTLHVIITIERSLVPDLVKSYVSTNTPMSLLDDGLTNSSIYVSEAKEVLETQVGVRVDHSRVSDLSLTLTSPQGTKVLLFENRGGTNATALGIGSSNYVYAVFTDATNVDSTLIKFAVPPYGTTNDSVSTNVSIFTSTFDSVTAANYTNGITVDGWLVPDDSYIVTNSIVISNVTESVTNLAVVTNMVSVVKKVGGAYSGNQYLALGSGRITRTETNLLTGEKYRLSYAYRSPGLTNWWPGDAKANDIMGNDDVHETAIDHVNGMVGKCFKFNGSDSQVDLGTQVGNFGTNDFSIEYWMRTSSEAGEEAVLEKRLDCVPGVFWDIRTETVGTSPGRLFMEVADSTVSSDAQSVVTPTSINDGLYHHVVFERADKSLRLFLDGVMVDQITYDSICNLTNTASTILGQSVCVGRDGTEAYSGEIDELSFYNRALSEAEVVGIYNAGSAGKYGNSMPQAGGLIIINGVTNELYTSMNVWQTNSIVFEATNSSVSFELDGRPLGLLFDSVQLELLAYTNYDNYFKPEESMDVFKGENSQGDWTLGLTDTRTGKGLASALLSWELMLTYSSTNVSLVALTNGVSYTNTIPAGTIQYFGVDVPSDAKYATNYLKSLLSGSPLTLMFNQSGLPTGNLAGDMYLLTEVEVGTNVLGMNSVPTLVPGVRYFLGLQNTNTTAVPYELKVDFDVSEVSSIPVLTNAVPYKDVLNSAGTINYYAFDVDSDSTDVSFEVLDPSSDVDLIIRHTKPFPTENDFDYLGDNSRTNDEYILVTTNSVVPLNSGRWYLGVYQYESASNVTYSVQATEWASTVVTLTNLVPYTNTVLSGGTKLFAVNVPDFADMETNILTGTNGSKLSLYFNQNRLPTGSQSDDVALLTSVANGMKILTVSNAPVLRPGLTYYLAVTNLDQVSRQFSITVGAHLDTNVNVTPLTNAISYTNTVGVTSRMQYYSFDVTTNAVRAAFDIFGANGDVALLLKKGTLPTRTDYDGISQNSGTNDESIILLTNSTPVSLTSGTWYLSVFNVNVTNSIKYVVRASQWLWNTDVIFLVDGLSTTVTVPTNGTSYFAVYVPEEVQSVTNLLMLVSPTNPLTMFYSDVGLPIGILPGDVLLSNSVPLGTNVFSSNTVPVLKTDQYYYLGVTNTNSLPEKFKIEADFQYKVTPLTEGDEVSESFSQNSVWQYYSYDVSTNADTVSFEVVDPTGDVTLVLRYGAPLPTLTSCDYSNVVYSGTDDAILVTTNSTPVKLKAGRWYVGVYKNSAGGIVNYSLLVKELSTPSVPPTTVTGGVTYTNTIGANSIAYFVVKTPKSMEFATNSLTVNDLTNTLNLLINKHTYPGMGFIGDYTLLQNVQSGESILSTDGTTVPKLTAGQTYYLGVENTNDVSVDFLLLVDFGLNGADVVTPLENGIAHTNSMEAGDSQYYYYDVNDGAKLVAFDVFGNTGDVVLLAHFGYPLPTLSNYDYVSDRTNGASQSILIRTNSTPVSLTAGRWYLSVQNDDAESVFYNIRATELDGDGGPTIVDLTNEVLATEVAGPGLCFDANLNFTFYQFAITNENPGALFTVDNMNGNVDLFVRKGDYPSFGLFDSSSFNSGTAKEVAAVVTSSTLPSLVGTWYVAVPNQTANLVSFDISTSLLEMSAVYPSIETWNYTGTNNNQFSFTWSSIAGVSYAIDISTNLPEFYYLGTVTASGDIATFVDPTPMTNSFRYYRVRMETGH